MPIEPYLNFDGRCEEDTSGASKAFAKALFSPCAVHAGHHHSDGARSCVSHRRLDLAVGGVRLDDEVVSDPGLVVTGGKLSLGKKRHGLLVR